MQAMGAINNSSGALHSRVAISMGGRTFVISAAHNYAGD